MARQQTMELYLIRHATAEDREEFAQTNQDDSLRPLTIKGRKRMQKVAIRLRDLISEVDLIVTSPYLRARQTAEILSQMFFETKIVEAAELVPHGPPQAFVRWLKAHARDHQSLAVVGHEPQLSLLASYLLAGVEESLMEIKKSGIVCLETLDLEELGPSSAGLSWLIPPKIWVD